MIGTPRLRGRWAAVIVGVGVAALAGTAGQPAAQQDRREWRDYGGSPDSSRYIPSTQITKANVTQLAVAWNYPYGETGFNPIVARGVVYGKGRGNAIVALEAATGKEIWIHDGLDAMTRRGMNYWESADGRDRRLIFSMNDYLQEIDAATGKSITTFGTGGGVDLREGLGRDPATVGRIASNSPGKVFENLIILGSATGEAYMSPPGDVRAFDVVTGKLVWQFHTVPHPGEPGYETWPKDAWRYVGGTNTWGDLTVDAGRGIAYFPTGSGTYDFYGADRVGANLYANCLLALNARTGKYMWHYQMVHHDLWDYDNTAPPMLTTIRQNGRTIDVVAQAGKTGFLYVFDRVTGAPIWPIEERPVPTRTEVPGEQVWPTQPFPTNPPPFGLQKFTVEDLNPYLLRPAERETFRQRIIAARNEGLFTPIGFTESVHMPGNNGGANWGSTAANPNDGTVYVENLDLPALLRLLKPEESAARGGGGGGGGGAAALVTAGEALYERSCQQCHGANRAGSDTGISLVGVTTKLSPELLRSSIKSGRPPMPPFPTLTDADLNALAAFLVNGNPPAAGNRGRGAGAGPAFPPGPVVATGPAATRPPSARGRGAAAYPTGAEVPPQRYQADGYGLFARIIKPPFVTLTAYDLNVGKIKWQIGLGDDPNVLREGGPPGTGQPNTPRVSIINTATGLIFVNDGNSRIHAYDADNGKQLWETTLGAPSTGSGAMYELNGRQYLLVAASGGGSGSDPTKPRGYVAFALPATAK